MASAHIHQLPSPPSVREHEMPPCPPSNDLKQNKERKPDDNLWLAMVTMSMMKAGVGRLTTMQPEGVRVERITKDTMDKAEGRGEGVWLYPVLQVRVRRRTCRQ